MKSIQKNIVSDFDYMTIKSIVSECNSLDETFEMIRIIFKHKIKPNHYIMAGYLIGESQAAYKLLDTINQINSLCQRQN